MNDDTEMDDIAGYEADLRRAKKRGMEHEKNIEKTSKIRREDSRNRTHKDHQKK